ncbi:MAG: type IV pilus secretin PilQ [Pseudomonadota bacterium]|nr:type IV pilus secretin PilQ [Pseudomonadota bacterium]
MLHGTRQGGGRVASRGLVALWMVIGVLSAIGILSGIPGAARAAALTLDEVSFTTLPGNEVQVRLGLSGPPGKPPQAFTIDNPARIALDFADTRLNLADRHRAIGVGPAQSVTAVEAGGRTRVVLNLVRQVPYDLRVEGSAVVVTLHSGGAMMPDVPSVATTPVATGPRPAGLQVKPGRPIPARPAGPGIEDVDFRRGEAGEGRIIVLLSESGLISNVREEAGQIIIDFPDAALPERLDRRLDVLDFATPVKEVDTFPHEGGARMVITPSGHYEHLAYQSDKVLTVDVKPLTKEEEQALKKEKFGYTGEKLSLNFQDIEVRAVLQLIADFTQKNLVATDTVAGNVTLRLKNVPWDQALDIILKSKDLDKRESGNVIMVAPRDEIATREKSEAATRRELADLAPLKTEFIELNYAKAADVATLLKTEGNKLVSKDGQVSVDQRTNTLLVQETAEKLAEMRKVITTLDVPVRQVLIESRIVIANQDFSRELGVKFGYSKNSGLSTDNFGVVVGGTQPGDTNFADGTATAFTTDDLENFIVDLPAATPAGAIGLAVGKIGSYLLQLELSALQAEGRGEVVSSPRVITTDQKEAVIEQGSEIPYVSQTSSGATDIEFKKAVLSLRVTPHITPDDRINMSIQVNKDSVGQVFANVPSIDTRNVTTEVLVDNGETVVLGGIYEHANRNDVRRVPFFGELPYFGTLFRNTLNARNKDELLIFVTPKVMKESLTLR